MSGGPNQFNKETMEKIQKFLRGEYTDPSKPEYYGTIADPKSGKWKDYTGAFANTDWFSESNARAGFGRQARAHFWLR